MLSLFKQSEINTALIVLAIAILGYVTALIKKKMTNIEKEVTPNHGSSARDAIERTEDNTSDIINTLRQMQKDIGGIRSDIRHLHSADQELARVDREHRERADDEYNKIWSLIRKGTNGD